MDYFKFYLLKRIIKKLPIKKILFIFILLLFIYFIKSNVFAVQQTTNPVLEIEQEILNQQELYQNLFVYHCLYPYEEQTEMWTEGLEEIFDYINDGYDMYVRYGSNNDDVQYNVRVYHMNRGTASSEAYYNILNDNTTNILFYSYSDAIQFVHDWHASTNDGTIIKTTNYNLKIPGVVRGYKSPLMLQFLAYINGSGINNYAGLLNEINNSLDDIDTVNEDILDALIDLSSSLSSIETNTSTDYSQQIGQISSKISDILDDNDTIISQNSQMIQQQEAINDNVQELKDTITDSSVTSTASDLPSTSVSDPTASGIDNIFQSIYNAFCVGQAQDIVFPIPFTDKNITLSPYYVSDMLNNNNAGWVYTLIQAFWGYLIGRYIVSDISKKIDKIKSGDIENVENSNIKEEML